MTLRYAGKCRDCGIHLPAGSEGTWHGRGRGISCPDCGGSVDGRPARGRVSNYATFSSGETVYQNRAGRCEDAPCCGCCS